MPGYANLVTAYERAEADLDRLEWQEQLPERATIEVDASANGLEDGVEEVAEDTAQEAPEVRR